MQDFHKVDAWSKAHDLTLRIYRSTENFPREETFGLAVQLRRVGALIPMKIAEGCGKSSNQELVSCLQQARGSGVDLEYLLLLARDLEFIKAPEHDVLLHQLVEVRKMLSGFIKTVSSVAI